MIKKILVVGPAWVGDMVMAQCLFKLLKQHNPQVIIDVLAPAWSQALLERMPEVSTSIILTLGHGQLDLSKRNQIGKELREASYDQAIVLPNSFKSALIPWIANIPLRTGWLGELRWIVLNDRRRLNPKKYPLMIERFMALGLPANQALPKDYPIPCLQVTESSQQAVLSKHQVELTQRPVLVLCPGAEFGPSKRWPAVYYAQVAEAKLKEGWDVWVLGSTKEAEITANIMELTQHKCINLTGRTNLVDAVDLLSLATVVVTNDSGLMHIAAAVGRPLVAIYGSTSPDFTPPLSASAKILQLALPCQPCFKRECPLLHHRCMRDLHANQVLNAIGELQ